MKKLAIVSSYNEECGAAFYSSRLKIHLESAGFAVDVKRLPVALLRIAGPPAIRRKGDAEIRRIALEIAEYDAVLLQFEPGLYGSSTKIAYRRARHLLQAAKKAVITVHGYDRRQILGGSISIALQSAMTWQWYRFSNEMGTLSSMSPARAFWHWVRRSPHVHLMTFNEADKTLLQRYFDLPNTSHYPITYYDQGQVQQIKASVDRERLLIQYGLDPTKKYFGVFGFFSPYKGHLSAMKALEYLPEDWNLAIIGGEHPQAIAPGKDIGEYMRQLLAFSLEPERANRTSLNQFTNSVGETLASTDIERLEIRKLLFERSEFKYFMPDRSIRDRIKFLGQVSDDDMPKFYSAIDYAVHPYMRTLTGQSGSGPATFAIEFGAKALFTNVPVFREMERYFKNALTFFNVGNFVELAESLQRFDHFENALTHNREIALRTYNPAGMVEAYKAALAS
jgi:glycosyltransferase involved in cell wall biosynthesis